MKTPEEHFSPATYGLISVFLLLFQVFIILSLSNHVWDQELRIVVCVLLSAVLNLASLAAILYGKKNFFEIFFLLSLAVLWIGTFHSSLDRLSCLLSQKVAVFLEAELYFMCLIVLVKTPTKVMIAIIGYLRIFIGLNLEEMEEFFPYEKIIGVLCYVLSFLAVGVLSLTIMGNNAGKYFLQQKQQMRYTDLENILNNDIQQGILIVTPNKSTQQSQLRVGDLKVKYVNNCFLEQFNVSRLLALNVLPLVKAVPPKLSPKIDQDISYNFTDSTKNILDRSVDEGGGEVPKNGIDQIQRRSIFATDLFKGGVNGVKIGTEGSEMNGKSSSSRDEEHQNIVLKPNIMRTSIFKKESLIKVVQNAMSEYVQPQQQQQQQVIEQQIVKNQLLSPDKLGRQSIENNNLFNRCWRRKESHEGTISSTMNLLDGVNLYHQNYLQKKMFKKPCYPLLESQLIVWEYKKKNAAVLAAAGTRKSFPSKQTNKANKTVDGNGVINKQNHEMTRNNDKTRNLSYLSKNNSRAQTEQQEQPADANIADNPYPEFQQNISIPRQNTILNQKLVNSSSSPSNCMREIFSVQASSTLEMQPFQNQPTVGSSEVAFSKHHHHHENKKLSMTIPFPNPERDMKNSRKSTKRPRSYLNHNDKLSAQQVDDNTFEIVRKDKKSKTEISRGRGGKKQDSEEDDINGDDEEDGNSNSITDYFDIKLFECEMGKEESIMIVVNKVNERIKYEKLKEQQEKSEEMLANVTHDLKTPLNCMTLMAEGMKIGKEYDDIAISMILENANLLMCLIQDILDYSQIKKGKLRLLRTTFTPNEAINEVMSLFQMQADQKNIQLISSVEQNFTMNSDKNRIKQILINLVGNALKFTQQGSISITCQIDHHKIATFSVKDTGVGMTNQIKSQLFKKFNTFNQKGLNKNGVGLGLTICKRLVTFLGPSDTIDVESEVAKGSVFSFKVFLDLTDILDSNNKSISEESDDLAEQASNNKYYEEQLERHKNQVNKCTPEQELSGFERSRSISISANLPFQKLNYKDSDSNDMPSNRSLNKEEEENKIEDSDIAVNSLPPTVIHSHAEFRNSFPQQISKLSMTSDFTTASQLKTMLIVDDSPFNIAAYKLILKKYKQPLSIIEAYNGKDAFEKYQKTSFACILMDYSMPIMNGDETTRLIRKFEKLNNLPACKIIIVSGFDNHRKEINKAMQFGADDFLTKPVNFKLLFEKLNQLLA